MIAVTWHADGTVTFEAPTAADAVEIIRAIHNDSTPARRGGYADDTPLSPALYEVWEWLTNNDNPEGTSPIQIGQVFGILTPTANYRLNRLVKNGVVHRVARGRYRVGES